MLTYVHIPSPHWRQRRKSHRDAVEITLKKLASVASIRLRGKVMAAKPEDAPQQYRDVTTLRQTCHSRSRRRQISKWRRL